MPTLPSRARVSLLAILALGACTTHTFAPRTGVGDAEAARPVSLRFVNGSRDRVHVYLVGERREWLLGRVEPGAVAWLAMPGTSLTAESGRLRLAVLAGTGPSLQAARDARAVQSMIQPATALLEREWSFSQGQLLSLRAPARMRR